MTTTAGRERVVQENSPDALDTMIRTSRPGGWIALICTVIVIVIAFVWSITARIPQEVKAVGSIVTPGDVIDVVAPVSGSVDRLPLMAAGGSVDAGEVLYTVKPFGSADAVEVKAPAAGRITATTTRLGATVAGGQTLATIAIAGAGEHNFATATLPQLEALSFPVGAMVKVAPVTTDIDVNGAMIGQIVNQSQPPESKNGSDASTSGGPTFTILIGLGDQPAWTGQPPDFQPADGTQVTITRVVANPHPIELLFGG